MQFFSEKKGRKSKEELNRIEQLKELGFSKKMPIYKKLELIEDDNELIYHIFKEECISRKLVNSYRRTK